MTRNIWVYDLEIFPNFFSCVAKNIDSNEVKEWVIHETRNDLESLYKWLTSEGLVLIGFNNINFDYQLLHVILKMYPVDNTKSLVTALYYRAQEIIDNFKNEREKKIIPEYKQLITQIDLYKIMHFDNSAKATSLKWLEFALRMKNVQDLPLHHTSYVEANQIENVLKYNLNDVDATFNFFNYQDNYGRHPIREAIALRANISNEYGFNAMNFNDVKIGVEIFAKELSQEMGVSMRELKSMRTPRDTIALNDCILPYVEFKSSEFTSVLTFLKQRILSTTKGAFSKIPLHELGALANHCATAEQHYVNGKIKSKSLIKDGALKKLNVVYKGFQYDFGTGGIHGCIQPGIYRATDDYVIIDIDVASYYPNLAINNDFRPEHLGESFSRIYKSIYERRKTYPKSNPNNAALKLALNGCFGKMNSEYSYLYDPQALLKITLNGQLLLCMLAENIVNQIDDCTMLQINTDGMTVKIHQNNRDLLMNICKQWEEFTKLTLEYVDYESMIIRDVNNYIGVYGNGKYKHKGTFEIDRQWHKNHSRRIVAIAVHNYFIHNVPVEQTIRQHIAGVQFNDEFSNHGIYDYCSAKKAVGSFYYESRSIVDGKFEAVKLDNKIIRYFVANKGDVIVKRGGRSDELVEAHPMKGKSFYLTLFNEAFDSTFYDINYNYYIREANKLIHNIEVFQKATLW